MDELNYKYYLLLQDIHFELHKIMAINDWVRY